MTNVLQSGDLQPVDFQTIKEGAKVIIQIPGSLYNNQQGEIVDWDYNKGTIEVRFIGEDQNFVFSSRLVFYAPESKPENQDHPKAEQKPVDEWVPEVGDQVYIFSYSESERNVPIINYVMPTFFGSFGTVTGVCKEYTDRNCRLPITAYFIDGNWWPICALRLKAKGVAKKADSPGTVIPVASDDVPATKPFDFETAKKLIEEGPISKRLVLFYYPELGKKELPMSWEELGSIDGYWMHSNGRQIVDTGYATTEANKGIYPSQEDLKASTAMAQLLHLRQAWLAIEAPGWAFDWSDTAADEIWIIFRCNMEVTCTETGTAWEPLHFPTKEMGNRFLAAFPELLRTAFCLPTNTTTSENNNKD